MRKDYVTVIYFDSFSSNNRFSLFQQLLRNLLNSGVEIDGIGLQSHIKGNFHEILCHWNEFFLSGFDVLNFNEIQKRLDALWTEFKLPIWITEFDWNANGWDGDGDIEWGDHTIHAQVLEDFYTFMFSQEVIANQQNLK